MRGDLQLTSPAWFSRLPSYHDPFPLHALYGDSQGPSKDRGELGGRAESCLPLV